MKRVITIFLSFVFMANTFVQENEKDTRAPIKALFLYNFCTLCDWPKKDKTGNFVIGVYGKTNLYSELVKKYSSKSIGSQQIELKQFDNQSDITKCHILYITQDHKAKISTIAKSLKGESTLIITDIPGILQNGSMINFVMQKGRQGFEISKTNATKRHIIIGSKLIQLASKVE